MVLPKNKTHNHYNYEKKEYKEMIVSALNDSSYAIVRSAVKALLQSASEDNFDLIASGYFNSPFNFDLTSDFAKYLLKIQNFEKFKKGVDMIIVFRDAYLADYQAMINDKILKELLDKKESSGLHTQAEYIRNKLGIKTTN